MGDSGQQDDIQPAASGHLLRNTSSGGSLVHNSNRAAHSSSGGYMICAAAQLPCASLLMGSATALSRLHLVVALLISSPSQGQSRDLKTKSISCYCSVTNNAAQHGCAAYFIMLLCSAAARWVDSAEGEEGPWTGHRNTSGNFGLTGNLEQGARQSTASEALGEKQRSVVW